MDNYTIKKAFHWTDDSEIEIKSENLHYGELGSNHSGCQSSSLKNNDKIHKLCVKLSEIVKEIDKLNKEI